MVCQLSGYSYVRLLSFLKFLIFEIQDLSWLTSVSRPDREDLRSKKFTIHFLWTASFDSAAQANNSPFPK